MSPLHFEPILKRLRWGGRRLGTALGKPIGEYGDYAESWEVADCGNDQSIVAAGPFRGWQLARLVRDEGPALLGRHRNRPHFAPSHVPPSHFPLLVKFLDANDRLSVQVHPDDRQARRMGLGDNGKTEAWFILDAQPGSLIYAGLKTSVDRRLFAERLEAGSVEDCLHSFPARRGDCVYVPAGTVHAIGEGILLAEIQQSSDVTFRIHDWGRLGADGKPRTLHRDEAMACIDFERGPVWPVAAGPASDGGVPLAELVRCEYFVMTRQAVSRPVALPDDDRFRIVMPVAGALDLACGDDRRRIRVGDTVLVPASAGSTLLEPGDGPAAVLLTSLP